MQNVQIGTTSRAYKNIKKVERKVGECKCPARIYHGSDRPTNPTDSPAPNPKRSSRGRSFLDYFRYSSAEFVHNRRRYRGQVRTFLFWLSVKYVAMHAVFLFFVFIRRYLIEAIKLPTWYMPNITHTRYDYLFEIVLLTQIHFGTTSVTTLYTPVTTYWLGTYLGRLYMLGSNSISAFWLHT